MRSWKFVKLIFIFFHLCALAILRVHENPFDLYELDESRHDSIALVIYFFVFIDSYTCFFVFHEIKPLFFMHGPHGHVRVHMEAYDFCELMMILMFSFVFSTRIIMFKCIQSKMLEISLLELYEAHGSPMGLRVFNLFHGFFMLYL